MNWFRRRNLKNRSKSVKDSLSLAKTRAKEVDSYLKEEKKRYATLKAEPKLLILGSSDSGKSTLLKQLKILHGGGFSEEDKRNAIIHVRENLLSACACFLSEIYKDAFVQEDSTILTSGDKIGELHLHQENGSAFNDLVQDEKKSKSVPISLKQDYSDLHKFAECWNSKDQIPDKIKLDIKYLWNEAETKRLYENGIFIPCTID
jgi:hypothetical protein